MVGGLLWFSEKLSRIMNVIAYIALTFIMLLTVSDVILRSFKLPIIGTFEMVGMGGAVVIGFGIPLTSWHRGLIYVDFVIQKFPNWGRNAINVLTRIVCIALFVVIGYNLFIYATDLFKSGEVSLTRQIPFYPIAYGLGFSCFVQCLVLIADIIKIIEGKYE